MGCEAARLRAVSNNLSVEIRSRTNLQLQISVQVRRLRKQKPKRRILTSFVCQNCDWRCTDSCSAVYEYVTTARIDSMVTIEIVNDTEIRSYPKNTAPIRSANQRSSAHVIDTGSSAGNHSIPTTIFKTIPSTFAPFLVHSRGCNGNILPYAVVSPIKRYRTFVMPGPT
jgi:hypothetical protein